MASPSTSHDNIEEEIEEYWNAMINCPDNDNNVNDPAPGEFLQPNHERTTTCKLVDLPMVDSIEKPRTPRKQRQTPFKKQITPSKKWKVRFPESPSASTADLETLTPSDIELAGSTSSNSTQELKLIPVAQFMQAASFDETSNSSSVLLVPLETVNLPDFTFVTSSAETTPINSEPNTPNKKSPRNAPINSKPSTANHKSKKSPRNSPINKKSPRNSPINKKRPRYAPINPKPNTPNQKSRRKSSPVMTDPLSLSTEEPTVPKRTCRRLLPFEASTSAEAAAPSTSDGEASSSGSRSGYEGLTDAEIQARLALVNDSDDDEEESTNVDLEPLPVPRIRQLQFSYDSDDDEDEPPPLSLNMDWEPSELNDYEIADPADRFHFEWRSFSSTALQDPETRRLPFNDSDCGPTINPATPYDAFTQIWDQQIVEHIVRETNDYARLEADCRRRELPGYQPLSANSRIKSWKDLDVDEFYRYIALVLSMGMVIKSKLEEYWDSNTESTSYTPGFARVMSINRFQLLNRYLHFNSLDPEQPVPESVSRLFKIQPILDHLNSKFSSLYRPARNLAIDESLTLWKGWLSIKQIIKNKTSSVGVKSFEVCESDTGYLYRIEVYAGEHAGSSETPISGTVPSLVLRLLEGLEHKGHTVWMDNYYNSPALARELRYRGFDCVGTLRLNRQLVPVELKNLTKTDLAKGEVRGCTSGDVDILVWRDKRQVALISTYHGLATAMDKGALKPSIVPDYNVCMGGVDTKDQVLAMYPVERTRGRVWYKKYTRRLVNVSVHNAYVIYKAKHKISHRRFRHELIKELLLRHKQPAPPSRTVKPVTSATASSISSLNLTSRPLNIPRTPNNPTTPNAPITIPTLPFCILGRTFHTGAAKSRGSCILCKKRMRTYCKKCEVFVCDEPCFQVHGLETFNRLYKVART